MNQGKYNCIIVDDEHDAIEMLSFAVAELYSNITISATFGNWKPALDWLRNNHADILFLDISMPQKNGLELLSLIPELNCEIILVTAYSEYAFDAFKFGVTGYLLKPIDNTLFVTTINKAIERVNYKKLAIFNQKNTALIRICIPNHKGQDYLDVDNILYFEALKRQTKVVEKDKVIFSSYNIGKFKELVPELPFFQVHRSFIVNLRYVVRYETVGILIMSNGDTLPLSKTIREEFQQIFESFSPTKSS